MTTIIIASITSIGCAKLSKEEVKRQLVENLKKKDAVYCSVGYDAYVKSSPYPPRITLGITLGSDDGHACMNQLIENGFAKPGLFQEKKKAAELEAIFSDAPQSRVEESRDDESRGKFLVRCARYEVDEVKSVTTEGKHAVVTYGVKVTPEPGAQALSKCRLGKPSGEAGENEAKFRQDDDGKWSLL